MRAFAEAYPLFTIVQQRVAQLPWGHHIVILTKSKLIEERIFYINKCLEKNSP